jgi:DNA polymerase
MAAEPLPAITSLKALSQAEHACTRCPLYKNATQAVPGEGAVGARIMFVGEQPGNDEDTNAVKHFKFEPRGKRRLHKKPNAYEIDRCNWWLDLEKKIVKPELYVALGATGARALAGRVVTISKVRGTVMTLPDGGRMVVTVHPSSLLRMPDSASRKAAYREFVNDMRFCAKVLAGKAA